MKINAGKWKKFAKRNLLIYLFLVIIFACGGYGVMSAALSVPDNPMSEQVSNLESDITPLNSDAEEDDTVYIPLTVKSEDTDDGQELESTEDALSEKDQQDTDTDTDQDQDQNSSPSTNSSTATSSPGTSGTGGNTEAGNTTDDTVYFTTSINDGETVTKTDYYFEIYHKIDSLTVKQVYVYVNGTLETQFDGNVTLSEGKNTIRVAVDYTDTDGTLITAAKSYTVNVDTASLIINTDLTDGETVTSKYLTFHASATYLGDDVDLTVKQDKTVMTGSDGTYDVTLKTGENVFTLSATAGNLTKTISCTVTYTNDGKFAIDTNLSDQTVNNSSITFKASLVNGDSDAKLTVYCNSNKVSGTDGVYTASLAVGNNTIRMVGVNGDGTKVTKTITITFQRSVASADNPIPDPDHAPTLTVNVTEGMSVSSSIFTLNVLAKDYNGNRIYGNNITVELNGTEINYGWQDDTATTYRLNLSAADNTLTILLVDENEYSALYTYHFTYTATDAPIGTITVSIEASTVGLGYLIEPTTVEIYNGESGAYVLDDLLTKNGITYSSGNGTLDVGFYLARICKDGIASNYDIPDDLVAALAESGIVVTNQYDANSLGEFDFYQESGWMYQINGDYPNYSFSDYYPADGDIIRIRYTLANGKDIGGAASTGGVNNNYDKEW